MKSILRVIVAWLGIVNLACAGWSEFVVLTDESEEKHKPIFPWIYKLKDDPDMLVVAIPFTNLARKFWLVTADRKLTDKELKFREMIWRVSSRNPEWTQWKPEAKIPKYVQSIAPLVVETHPDLPRIGPGMVYAYVHRDAIDRTYVYLDYPPIVFDGGYYYCYRLSAFTFLEEAEGKRRIKAHKESMGLTKGPVQPRSKE